jgi:hypothetical protein
MPDTVTILGALRALVAKLPAWAVRRWYPAQRLANLLYVDIYPRNDPAWISFGSTPEVRVTLQVINLSPFPCELEQGQLNLQCEGVTVKLNLLQRMKLAPAEVASVYLHESLSDGQARSIRANWGSSTTSLAGTIEVASSVNRFTKHVQALSGIHVHPANLSLAKTDA